MKPIPPSGRPNPLRRWFLSLLTTRPARHLLHHTLLAALALQLSAPSWNGSDFQVNTYTTNWQSKPDVALNSDGDFVIVWQSYGSSGGDTSSNSIQAQRYNSTGVPQGEQFQVNTYTTGNQSNPAIALDSNGDFVVVWESEGSYDDASGYSIQGQRYDSAGVAQGSQFQINSYTTANQRHPDVAQDSNGSFVIVWQSYGSSDTDTSGYSIQGQQYNSAGKAQDSQFQVNSYTTGYQELPSVSLDSDGDFVVVWNSAGSSGGDTSGYSIQGQRYNSAGESQGNQFQVNSYTTGDQFHPNVALDSNGDFAIVWNSDNSSGSDTSSYSIQGQRYNAVGVTQGSQFQVNSYTTNEQRFPAVSMNSNGDFVVVWRSDGSYGDSSHFSVQGQRYNQAGAAHGSQFQANIYTTSNQLQSAVSLDSTGNFVIVWSSYGHTTDPDWTIAARLFSLQPTDVSLVTPHPATPSLPTIATFLALLTALTTLLLTLYHRLRPSSSSIP